MFVPSELVFLMETLGDSPIYIGNSNKKEGCLRYNIIKSHDQDNGLERLDRSSGRRYSGTILTKERNNKWMCSPGIVKEVFL